MFDADKSCGRVPLCQSVQQHDREAARCLRDVPGQKAVTLVLAHVDLGL